MKRTNSPSDLHLELLEQHEIRLGSDGLVYNKDEEAYPFETITIGYRDEGPDAWASSTNFSGPTWLWTDSNGWRFYKNGVSITGYYGLSATVVTIEHDELHITKCNGEEY